MIKRLLIPFILGLTVLTGCSSQINAAPDTPQITEAVPETAISILTEPSEISEEFLETIEPVESELITNTHLPQSPTLSVTPGHHMLSFTDRNTKTTMKYWLFVPDNATINMPLIVYLHGMGQIDKIHELENVGPMLTMDSIYGNDFPFLLLYPNTPVRSWTADPIPDTLKSLIDHVAAAHQVDTNRIVITGHSMGAVGTWNMLSRHGDYFSAAVPISCPNDGKLDFGNLAKVPIRAFVGNGGEIERNYGKGMNTIVYNTNLAGGDANLTIFYDCTHTTTPVATYTPEVFDWMLSQ